MKWLFVSSKFPWPIIDGHWLRVYHFARTLRELGEDVGVLSFRGGAEGEQAYDQIGVHVVPGPEGVHTPHGPSRPRLGPYAFDAALARSVAQHASQFDVVVLSGGRMLQYSTEAAAAGRVIADLIDDPVLEFGRRKGQPGGIMAWARRWKNRFARAGYEAKNLEQVHVTTFASEADCESFSRRHPNAQVVFVPNGVNVDYFRPRETNVNTATAPPSVIFTGLMSNPNNECAAKFLVEEVAPLVWRQRPDVRVQIVGADPSPMVKALAGERVEITGRVEDIRKYLWSASVVALPMQSGTGIKNKLLEAWAAGAPVVATPLVCQGVPGKDRFNLLLGKAPQELADRVLELLNSDELRRNVGENGRQTVEQRLTWDSVARALREVAHGVSANRDESNVNVI